MDFTYLGLDFACLVIRLCLYRNRLYLLGTRIKLFETVLSDMAQTRLCYFWTRLRLFGNRLYIFGPRIWLLDSRWAFLGLDFA